MYLENLSWKFYQIFFRIFRNFLCLQIYFFFQFFTDFLGIFSNWSSLVDRMGSVDQIRKHLFSSPVSHFKPFLFSSNSFHFIFQPLLSHSLCPSTPKHFSITYSIFLRLYDLSFSQKSSTIQNPQISISNPNCIHPLLVDRFSLQWHLGLVQKGKENSLLERSHHHTLTTPVTHP